MSIAFFPGKFQPVHLGHIISIMNIYDDYDKIIIGITEDKPLILSLEERRDIFHSIFKYLYKIEYHFLKHGALTSLESPLILPDFDVCLSGNQAVLDKMNEFGFKTKFLERSKGIGYKGEQLRQLIV